MKKQTIILRILGHVPAVARGGRGFWINLVSTIKEKSTWVELIDFMIFQKVLDLVIQVFNRVPAKLLRLGDMK